MPCVSVCSPALVILPWAVLVSSLSYISCTVIASVCWIWPLKVNKNKNGSFNCRKSLPTDHLHMKIFVIYSPSDILVLLDPAASDAELLLISQSYAI